MDGNSEGYRYNKCQCGSVEGNTSKVFRTAGFLVLQYLRSKRDKRLYNSGDLKAFRYQNEDFPLIPKTVFYDFIYIAAVKNSFTADEIKEISGYDYFTDIEFNPAKSINTQARAAAMIRLLLDEYGELPDFSKEDFIQYHKEHIVYDTLI